MLAVVVRPRKVSAPSLPTLNPAMVPMWALAAYANRPSGVAAIQQGAAPSLGTLGLTRVHNALPGRRPWQGPRTLGLVVPRRGDSARYAPGIVAPSCCPSFLLDWSLLQRHWGAGSPDGVTRLPRGCDHPSRASPSAGAWDPDRERGRRRDPRRPFAGRAHQGQRNLHLGDGLLGLGSKTIRKQRSGQRKRENVCSIVAGNSAIRGDRSGRTPGYPSCQRRYFHLSSYAIGRMGDHCGKGKKIR